MPAQQQALPDQFVDHGAQRRPAHAQVGRQAAFARQRVPDLQLVQHPEDLVPDERLLAATTVRVREPAHLSGREANNGQRVVKTTLPPVKISSSASDNRA